MSDALSWENVAELALQLSPAEQLRLVEHIVHNLASVDELSTVGRRRSWSEIRGLVAHPAFGEDAQQWVSRTRRESDEARELRASVDKE